MKVILRDERSQPGVASRDSADLRPALLFAARRRPRLLPYVVSTAVHVGCIWLVSLALVDTPPAKKKSEDYRAKAIMIRLPQQVFVPRLPQTEIINERSEATGRLLKSATALVSPLKKQPSPLAAQTRQVLVQPQYPEDLQPPPLSPAVPSVLVVAPQALAQPPDKAFTPSPIKRDMPAARMQEPMSDMRLSARIVDVPESVRVNAAALPVAPPARDTHPVAVLSVSDAPVTSQTVVVPPGNIIPEGGGEGAPGQTLEKRPSPATQEIIHAANGRFNIVVIQSSPDETLPAGLLTGKPVYTVYVPVGDTKEWIMHFSAGSSSVVQRGGFVQLPDPRPLNAPYPRVTVRPTEPLSAAGPYLLVRGSIDETGAFQNLQLLGPVPSGATELLDALSRWRFKPATRADSPERVQMVLAIPIQKL